MPRPFAPSFRALALALLAALPFASLGACATETGVTPTCVPNVDGNGVNPDVENGCTGFAICAKNPTNPAACCTGEGGGMYTGDKLAFCLLSYGIGAPTSGSGASSTSSGTGGAGGSK